MAERFQWYHKVYLFLVFLHETYTGYQVYGNNTGSNGATSCRGRSQAPGHLLQAAI